MRYNLKNRIIKNATWIIICRIFQAILNLLISMMIARYFGPTNYGLINYAAAVVAFFVPIMQLGFRSTLVQEYINNSEKEEEVLGTSLMMNIISSVLCIIGVVAFSLITNNHEKETVIVCLIYSVVLLFQATEMIQYWFQAKLLSKYTSIVSLVAYIVVSIYKVLLLVLKKSIYWFAASNVLDYFIISIGLFVVYRRLGNPKLTFSLDMAKQLLNRSKFYIVSSMMVTVFGHIGSVILERYLGKEAVGFYTAAITCAGITGFVFNAIIDSARPVILSYKNSNEEKYRISMISLYSIIIYVSILQSIGITTTANIIINILYGREYYMAVQPLRIIVWYTTFSYLGPVRNIWILAEGKQKFMWIINLSGAIVSIMLNFLLIPIYGVSGAAIASLITQIFTNVITGYFIKDIRECNELMVKGLNPKYLFNIIKLLRKA